jgi:hypothetical protein
MPARLGEWESRATSIAADGQGGQVNLGGDRNCSQRQERSQLGRPAGMALCCVAPQLFAAATSAP